MSEQIPVPALTADQLAAASRLAEQMAADNVPRMMRISAILHLGWLACWQRVEPLLPAPASLLSDFDTPCPKCRGIIRCSRFCAGCDDLLEQGHLHVHCEVCDHRRLMKTADVGPAPSPSSADTAFKQATARLGQALLILRDWIDSTTPPDECARRTVEFLQTMGVIPPRGGAR